MRTRIGMFTFAVVTVAVLALLVSVLLKGVNGQASSLVGVIGFFSIILTVLTNTGQLLQLMRMLNAHLQVHEESAKVATVVAKQAVDTAQETSKVVKEIAEKVNNTHA